MGVSFMVLLCPVGVGFALSTLSLSGRSKVQRCSSMPLLLLERVLDQGDTPPKTVCQSLIFPYFGAALSGQRSRPPCVPLFASRDGAFFRAPAAAPPRQRRQR